ncbi:MAG: hypothetical protein NXI16_08935 [Alphaproteobacteria bacterium]|nr:hypothetical protein [Alphaproteobacteria bacterium]
MDFTFQLRDENGATVIHDIECVLGVDVVWRDGEPTLDITSIHMGQDGDGPDICKSVDPFMQSLAARISTAAQCDEKIVEQALDDAGIRYSERGSNDPFGRWVA